MKDEARGQFRRTTGNVTAVFGTSTAPQGRVNSIHQSSRDPDPVRQVIIHQMNRDIELEKSTQQNAIGDSVGIRDHRSHPPVGRNIKPVLAKRAQHTHKQLNAVWAKGQQPQ